MTLITKAARVVVYDFRYQQVAVWEDVEQVSDDGPISDKEFDRRLAELTEWAQSRKAIEFDIIDA